MAGTGDEAGAGGAGPRPAIGIETRPSSHDGPCLSALTHLRELELAAVIRSLNRVRWILACTLLCLTACSPGLEFNISQDMSKDQMVQRATHIFVGVIEKQAFESWPFFSVPGFPGGDPKDRRYWRVLRRQVRVEIVVKGIEPRKLIDIYEINWTGASMGDWNLTYDKERDVFLVRVEDGRYHVVRDWWRSIFPIYSGSHTRLPLDDSRPFWERVGLLTWWVRPDRSGDFEKVPRKDPGIALGTWRTVKILRGLLRHPDRDVRRFACAELLGFGDLGQDECWEALKEEERGTPIFSHGSTPEWFSANHHSFEQRAHELWNTWSRDRDDLKLFTTVNDQRLRRDFCRLYESRFPDETDTGCPADRPVPATIVTEDGDVPLPGAWPQQW